MKSKIVYSFVALSAFPAIATAAVATPEAQSIPNADWTNTSQAIPEGQTEMMVVSNEGKTASQTVAGLAKGKYVLNIENLWVRNGDKVTVTVAGQSKSFEVETAQVSIEFELATAGDVTVAFSSEQGNLYAFKSANIELSYDFDEAKQTLQELLDAVTDNLDPRAVESIAKAAEIQDEIDGIEETYAAYKDNKFDEAQDNWKIAKEIAELEEFAAEETAGIKVDEVQGLLDAAKGVIDGLNELDSHKEGLTGEADALQEKVEGFDGTDDDLYGELKDDIAAMQEKAEQSAISYEKYVQLRAKIDAAKEACTDAQTTVAGIGATEVEPYGTIYEKVAANASAELNDLVNANNDALRKLNNAHSNYTLTDDDEIEGEIDGIKTAGQVVDDLNNKTAAIDDVYARATAIQEDLDGNKVTAYADTNIATKFGANKENWAGASGYADWATNYRKVPTPDGGEQLLVENYVSTVENTGAVMSQTIEGLAPGTYRIVLYGNAAYTSGRGFASDVKDGDMDVAYLFAETSEGTVKKFIPAYITTMFGNVSKGVLDGVQVGQDGRMVVGIGKDKAGTNWHIVQISEASAVLPTEDEAQVSAVEAKLDPTRQNVQEKINELIALFNTDNDADETILATDYDAAVGETQEVLDEFKGLLGGASDYARTVATVKAAQAQLNKAYSDVQASDTEKYPASQFVQSYVDEVNEALTPLIGYADQMLQGEEVDGFDDYAAIRAAVLPQSEKINVIVERATDAQARFMLIYDHLYGNHDNATADIVSRIDRLQEVENVIKEYKVYSEFEGEIQNLWNTINGVVDELNATKELSGTEHWDAVAALDWDYVKTLNDINSLAERAAAREHQYSVDNAWSYRGIMQGDADTKATAVQEAYDDYKDFLEDAETDLGLSAADYMGADGEFQAITAEAITNYVNVIAEYKANYPAEANDADLEENLAAGEELKALIDEVDNVLADIATARANAEEIAGKVQTQKDYKAAADEVIAGLRGEVADELDAAQNNPDLYPSAMEIAEAGFALDRGSVSALINALEEKIAAARAAETLEEADYAEESDDIQAIRAKIAEVKAAIEAVQTLEVNYAAAQDVLTEKQTLVANNGDIELADPTDDYTREALENGFAPGSDVQTALAKLAEDIETAYGNKALTADSYAADVEALDAAIAAVQASVEAAQANYDAYQDLLGKCTKVETELAKQEAGLTGGPIQLYLDKLDGYKTEFAALQATIGDHYNDGEAVAKKNADAGAIDKLLTAVKKVDGDAAANQATYEAQMATIQPLRDLYDEVYAEIEAGNANLDEPGDWLDQLATIEPTIGELEDAIEEAYAAGESVEQNTGITAEGASIKSEINAVYGRWSNDEYSDQIAAENEARYKSFTGAISEAEKAFTKAVKTQDAYANVENPALQAAIAAATGSLTEDLYEFPTQIQALLSEGTAAYGETISPDLFDFGPEQGTNDDSFLNKAIALANEIKEYEEVFKAAVVLNGVSFDGFETALNEAKEAIAGYSPEAQEDAFKDVEDLIAKGKSYVEAKDVVALDDVLNTLENGIDEMLNNDKSAAAVKDLQAKIDQKVEDSEAYLAILADLDEKTYTTKDEFIAEFEGAINDYLVEAQNVLDAAKTAKNAHADAYGEVEELLINYREAKRGVQHKVASVEHATTYLAEVQEYLDNTKRIVDQFYNGFIFSVLFDEAQGSIDEVDPNNTSSSEIRSIMRSISSLYRRAKEGEKAHLVEALADLKKLYTNLAAYNDQEELADDIEALKSGIDEVEANIPDDLNANDAGEILAELEAQVSDLYSMISDLDDSEEAQQAQAELVAALQAQADEVGEKIETLDGSSDEVKAAMDLGEIIPALNKTLGGIREQITKAEEAGTIVYNRDRIEGLLIAFDAYLDDLIEEAQEKQEMFDANNDKFAELTAAIDDLQQQLDDAKALVDAYETVNSEDYFSFESAQDYIDNLRELVQDAYDNVELTADWENDDYNEWTDNCTNYINEGKLNAARDEAFYLTDELDNNRVVAMQTLVREEDYSADVLDEIYNANDEIWMAINDLYDNIDQLYNDGQIVDELDNVREEIAGIQASIDLLSTLIAEGKLGDITGDGKVSVSDYSALINYIIGNSEKPEYGTPEFDKLDINGDGKINIGDAVALVNLILTGDINTAPSLAKERNGVSSDNDAVSVESADLGNGVTRYALVLNNESSYVSAQMDIVLPNGLSIVKTSLGERAAGHGLATGNVDGAYRVVISSVFNKAITGEEGAVVYIDVKTGENYKGEGIEFKEIVFSNAQANTREFVVDASEATEIAGVGTKRNSFLGRVYDYSGRLKNKIMKGFNIIKGEDGSTKKVYVK